MRAPYPARALAALVLFGVLAAAMAVLASSLIFQLQAGRERGRPGAGAGAVPEGAAAVLLPLSAALAALCLVLNLSCLLLCLLHGYCSAELCRGDAEPDRCVCDRSVSRTALPAWEKLLEQKPGAGGSPARAPGPLTAHRLRDAISRWSLGFFNLLRWFPTTCLQAPGGPKTPKWYQSPPAGDRGSKVPNVPPSSRGDNWAENPGVLLSCPSWGWLCPRLPQQRSAWLRSHLQLLPPALGSAESLVTCSSSCLGARPCPFPSPRMAPAPQIARRFDNRRHSAWKQDLWVKAQVRSLEPTLPPTPALARLFCLRPRAFKGDLQGTD
ncbi:transmembrane protein 221 isoform X1 [Alligator mississippiensis]|uniref:transmembrane protein 221 isoform X1 n=1 Tax=Alligator mississippiensis TaxID=8496 RepID=UPI002877B53D|nr:transmembrane protein 221 isoform X1 [Alligator mississippiensis]